ncbi:MAG: hypothetical protein NT118_00985 [Lentisphaerae bacterium]|nr:hypothetical protein [Lentisphaerota bacterium]
MNKRICALALGAMFAVSGLVFAEDSPNLLKNSELKAGNDKSLSDWTVRGKFSQDAGYKGPNSISMILEKDKEGSGGRAVMTQWVGKLKPGKYIFSAYIKLDRKIKEVVLIRFFMIRQGTMRQRSRLTCVMNLQGRPSGLIPLS